MAGYLQVEVGETQPHGEGCCKGNGRWYCAAWPIAGLGTCLLLVALSMWKTAQPPKPALEVAKDMGVQELLDLFLDDEGQNGQSAIQHHRDGMNFMNASMTANITDIRRQLQDMIQNPLALPIASCTVNVYLVASFIGILGNVINGADVACKKADKTKSVFKADAIVDLLPRIDNIISVKQKLTVQDLLDQGCRIGIETSVSLVAFIAGFLARAANDCAMTIKPVPNPGAGCASDMSLVSAGIAYLTAGAETAQAVCPPYPNDFDIDAEALDIVGGLSRRLRTAAPRDPKVEGAVDDVKEILISRLPALGPLAKTLLDNREFFKLRREAKKNHRRTEKDVKCGFDIAGVVGFTAAVGVFLTAGIMECPAATGLGAEAEAFKMGCSLDISAVIAALTTIAGFMGILATECPEKPDTPAKNLCVTAGFNIVSSLGFMSAALSDVKRQCGAL